MTIQEAEIKRLTLERDAWKKSAQERWKTLSDMESMRNELLEALEAKHQQDGVNRARAVLAMSKVARLVSDTFGPDEIKTPGADMSEDALKSDLYPHGEVRSYPIKYATLLSLSLLNKYNALLLAEENKRAPYFKGHFVSGDLTQTESKIECYKEIIKDLQEFIER